MARIDGVPARHAGIVARFGYWYARRLLGKVPEPLAVTAHHGNILQGYSSYEFFLARARLVDARLKALAGLKAAVLVGCPF